MNKKRQMWLQVCFLFAVVWGVLGLIVWPFLFMAVISLMMMLIPVGVSADTPAPKHDPNAWRTDQSRPWGKG